MLILAIFIGAVIGFAGGFMTASVFLFDDVSDEDNYADYYDPEEFR